MFYKYYFHIIDNMGGYDYQAYFIDHFEADRFITENERDGNTVFMVAPFIEEVPADDPDLAFALRD